MKILVLENDPKEFALIQQALNGNRNTLIPLDSSSKAVKLTGLGFGPWETRVYMSPRDRIADAGKRANVRRELFECGHRDSKCRGGATTCPQCT